MSKSEKGTKFGMSVKLGLILFFENCKHYYDYMKCEVIICILE